MKNPLDKRILREIKGEAGKNIVIFLFMTALIAIVSGFLIAGESLKTAYDQSFEKYNVEDGNFELAEKADSECIGSIESEDVTLFENFYVEENTDDFDSTLRIFADRKDVNKVCLLSGEMPESENEIALDRLYAKNNDLSIGDSFSLAGKSLKVVGIVALPDYSALFQNNTDFMFDSIKFGVAVMTDEGFQTMGDSHIHYSYSWKYDAPPADPNGKEAKDMAENFMKSLSNKAALTSFIPRCSSNAMNFAGDDLGGDRVMILTMMYVLIVIIAFVFAITTSNTISRESNVIGTLRASGYTKAELIRHYMAAPVIVLLIAAVVGNALGYTLFKNIMADQYLGSYSLVSYKTLWNATAFIETTIVPIAIMMLINFIMLVRMLSLSPLKFIRRDLKRRQKKKAFKLNTKIGIMTRFRLRVIFQNIPNYITIFVGVLFAGFILVFGTMFTPLLDYVEDETISNMIASHQYILKAPAETKTADAEKYCIGTLKTTGRDFTENISIYGISEGSRYIDADLSGENVYISSAYSDKYGLDKGDTITLKEEFGDTEYTLNIDGIYENPTTLFVFVNREQFNEMFDKDKDYYSGYLSNEGIEDIDDNLIAAEITQDDYTKSSRQLKQSMGSMMNIFWVLGVAVFMLVIYLLSKIIIEKNAQSISLAKILGYEKWEINKIYIHTTTIVTIVSLIAVLPIIHLLLNWVWHTMMAGYTGWIPCVVQWSTYFKVVVIGIITYAVVAALLMRQTKKVPLADALKNVE
ncbi:MAG: ABC transporter permease [Oscillospiraceae bacterium]|nr:ABC transporter permease [Oscillospiraceae bacterium]